MTAMPHRVSIPKNAGVTTKASGDRGEVRVKVKLTNNVDRILAARGQLPPDQVRSYVADALVDSGAVCTTIPKSLFDHLGLTVVGHRIAEYADGSTEIVDMAEPVSIEIDGRGTSDDPLVLGNEVLIGQTVLEKTDLLVDCTNRRLIGNPAHPDQPVLKVK
jgi:hypothetical protein